MSATLEELEQQTFEEDDSPEVPPPDVIAFNELRSCADLFRMWRQGILEIQPEFQREIVWKGPAQTRFIDSLVKQLPIPSMCFSLDYKTQKWQVIDGLQRMASITRFLSGEDWTLSKLDDIDPKLSGQPVSKFLDSNSDLHSYFLRVENLTLPITVLRCDYSKRTHTNYLFTIFHRLNAGGMKLNNQEIRNCIYGGTFNNLLRELNSNPEWMRINRMKSSFGNRFTKEELILRVFALHDRYQQYKGRLARFLNEYMDDHRNPSQQFLSEKKDLFERTVNVLYGKIYEGRVPAKLSISVLEAVLVGISLNLPFVESQPNARVQAMYQNLLRDDAFSERKLVEGLAGRQRLIERITVAKKIFSGA